VEVLHGGLDVGVTHPLLHAADVGLGDHPRSKRVAEVVKAQRAQAGSLDGREVAAAKTPAIEECAARAGEDEVVVPCPPLALSQRGKRGKRGRDVRRHRHRSDLARLRRRELTFGVRKPA
jgi:hypothetical protein